MRALTTGRGQRLTLLLALLLGLATPVAAFAAPTSPATPRYRVAAGDTITSIAVKLRVPGGWEALYRANAALVGKNPNRLAVGMNLALPTLPPAPAPAVAAANGRYVVKAGDTLSVIAERMKVPGGRDALYGANRAAIGADPNRLVVGMVLARPGTASAATKPAAQKPVTPNQAPADPTAVNPPPFSPADPTSWAATGATPADPASWPALGTTPAATTAPAAPAAPGIPVEPAGEGAASRPALLADPPHGTPLIVRTPPAAEIPAQPPAYPEPEPVNKGLLAGLLGSAFVLFVILIVYAVLPLRDPDKRAMRKRGALSGPSTLAAGALAASRRNEVHEHQIIVPEQRKREPLRIVLDKPEREQDDSKRLSA